MEYCPDCHHPEPYHASTCTASRLRKATDGGPVADADAVGPVASGTTTKTWKGAYEAVKMYVAYKLDDADTPVSCLEAGAYANVLDYMTEVETHVTQAGKAP